MEAGQEGQGIGHGGVTPGDWRQFWWIVGIITFGLLGVLTLARVHAEPPAGSDQSFAPWFQSLSVPGTGVSCCSISDCRTVRTRMTDGHLEAWVDKKDFGEDAPNAWVLVPETVMLHGKENPMGEPVLCFYSKRPWCFIEASGT